MTKQKQNFKEIDDIRDDLESLRNNVVELTKHVRRDGSEQVNNIRTMAEERLAEASELGRQRYQTLRLRVQDKPEQSLALAFAGGLLASYLMARR